MEKTEWIRCPVCGNKTRVQIREDTELKNFPLYCHLRLYKILQSVHDKSIEKVCLFGYNEKRFS